MKALLKIIWFALAVVLRGYATKPFSPEFVKDFTDKLNAYSPLEALKINPDFLYQPDFINQVIFVAILFLGLDIISGDIKGLIKGPIKIVFNSILYVIGFSIIFFTFKTFAITF